MVRNEGLVPGQAAGDCRLAGPATTEDAGTLFLNGWLGRREYPHRLGLVRRSALTMRLALLSTDDRENRRCYGVPNPIVPTPQAALLQGLEKQPDCEVHFISCVQEQVNAPKKLGANIYYHALRVPKIGWMRTGYQGCIRAVRRKLHEISPDIVHGQGTERDCAMSAVFSGYPNVITIHGNMRLLAQLHRARPPSFLCHAGCSFQAVLDALGLRTSDLFASPEKPARPKGIKPRGKTFPSAESAEAAAQPRGSKLAKSWQYRGNDGREAFRVIRFEGPTGKTYRPIHKEMDGLWRVGDPNGLLPLYRLQELLADPDAIVWVGEGEKVADFLALSDMLATTSAHGAKSAAKTDWSPLSGRRVVIVPDNDAPGQAYARDVASRLLALDRPARVRVLNLPGLQEGEDFEQYGTLLPERWEPHEVASHMTAMARATLPYRRSEPDSRRLEFGDSSGRKPDFRPSPPPEPLPPRLIVTRLSDVEPEAVRWLWPGRIALGKVTIVSGDPGLGKSFLTLDLARRVSLGLPWPDSAESAAPIGSTLLLSAEDGLADTIRPRLDAMNADVSRIYALETARRADGSLTPFSLKDDLPMLEEMLQTLADCRLIVIDPVTAYLGETDDHKNSQVRGLLAPLSDLAGRHGVAVVLVSHLNKSSGGKALYRSMGSLAFMAAARSGFVVVRDRDDPRSRLFLPVKNNLGAEAPGLSYTLDSGLLSWREGSISLTADEAMAADSDGSSREEPSKVDECRRLAPQPPGGRPHPRRRPLRSRPRRRVQRADGLPRQTVFGSLRESRRLRPRLVLPLGTWRLEAVLTELSHARHAPPGLEPGGAWPIMGRDRRRGRGGMFSRGRTRGCPAAISPLSPRRRAGGRVSLARRAMHGPAPCLRPYRRVPIPRPPGKRSRIRDKAKRDCRQPRRGRRFPGHRFGLSRASRRCRLGDSPARSTRRPTGPRAPPS